MTVETFYNNSTFTVPSGVDKLTVRLWGGQGNGTLSEPGGEGGFVEFEVSVSPGENYSIMTGDEAGQRDLDYDGDNDFQYPSETGYPGGGATVFLQYGNLIYDNFGDWLGCGAGGGGTYEDSGTQDTLPPGAGGPNTGEDGGDGSQEDGKGGTQSAGGQGGSNNEFNGASGGRGYGGGGGDTSGPPGGGDGYYGGGAGSYNGGDSKIDPSYSPAGGGSNYIDSSVTAISNQRGGNTGDGYAEIEYYQAPVAPSSVSVTVNGDDSFTVSWSGDANANNYRVQRQYDGGSWNTVATPNAGDRSITDTNANNANNVRYRVRTENTSGDSSYTYSPTVTTDPTNLSITATDASSVSLSWSGVDQPNSYEVQRSEGSGYSTVSNPAGTSYTDSGLENGEQYTYRVRANYGGADSDFTGTVTATTALPSPTIDGLDATTDREITVSYTCPDNSSDGDLVIERSRDGGSTWATATTLSPPFDGSFTDTGLLDGEQYTYRLTRSTDHATAQSGTAAATTNLPSPTGLSVGSVGDTSATLSWSATHNYGDTRVEFKRTSSSSWSTFETVARGTTSSTITGLLNGEEYDARVVATTEHRESEDA